MIAINQMIEVNLELKHKMTLNLIITQINRINLYPLPMVVLNLKIKIIPFQNHFNILKMPII